MRYNRTFKLKPIPMNLKYTKHANVRCQQRGIPKEAIEFIYKHGSTINTHDAKKYFCNKKKLRSLYFKERELITKFDKQILSTAIVCMGSTVLTAMKISEAIR